ncbi:MAG: endonuclease/exonuclease/phosphatase family protein [Bacteroidales bacterium]|jgi:predicted extracellular nuclease|nr:endonuclease/exonuclease/phosphatase family protein [Bacteroidales bacterium]
MLKGIVIRICGTVSLLILSFSIACSQDANNTPVKIMFYNVENLFDISDDTATDDDEFLPDGIRRWTYKKLARKTNLLYKTILAAGQWNPPAIVAMCEVENRSLLEDLIYNTLLSKFNYDIVHRDSPDPRGIDVCLIYRRDLVKILNFRYFIPDRMPAEKFTSRSVLYTKCLIYSDTIELFVNHWPSRRGGVLAADDLRMKMAETVKNKTDSILNFRNGEAKIIIMGDFNSSPDDQIMNIFTDKDKSGWALVNLSAQMNKSTGTFRYMGTWEMIDQVIVSDALINSNAGLYIEPAGLEIFRASFLLDDDPKYPGLSPFSTYRGYRYLGGCSDHLPVLIDLNLKPVF